MVTSHLFKRVGMVAVVLGMTACQNPDTKPQTAPPNSPPIQYVGHLPCADCESITTTIALNSTAIGEYSDVVFAEIYEGTSDGDQPFAEVCTAVIVNRWYQDSTREGKILTLFPEDQANQQHYLFQESSLLKLDRDLNKIESTYPYELTLTYSPETEE
ncbi:hypothetical protein F8C82_01210 [Phaeocystidibacter marisrubri]|uniref:Copper resistance protein NlpE n=2 Tax=Phaeocystidibacter marisrubri TaxID=1577780 RepID=A0A6L3ZG78_9FLAO|nr:hypothetical protein F8C82_01210 [Phaeocystidibacter marisrubri]